MASLITTKTEHGYNMKKLYINNIEDVNSICNQFSFKKNNIISCTFGQIWIEVKFNKELYDLCIKEWNNKFEIWHWLDNEECLVDVENCTLLDEMCKIINKKS